MVERAGIEVVSRVAEKLDRAGYVGLRPLAGGEHNPKLPLRRDDVLSSRPRHPFEGLLRILGFVVAVDVDESELVLCFRVAVLGGLPESFRTGHCIVAENDEPV